MDKSEAKIRLGLFKYVFQNSWIPDAVLAVGQPTVAIAEENTLSVFGLALKSKHLVNVQYFNHLGEMGKGGTSRCGVAELLAFGGI